MKDTDIVLFFNCGLVICILMAIVNLLRYKSRGTSAYFLAAAFAALGFLFLSLIRKWPDFVMTLCGILVAGCLVVDFILRAGKGKETP